MDEKEKDKFFYFTSKYKKEVLRTTLLPQGVLNSKSFRRDDSEIIPIKCEIPSTNKHLKDSKYYYEEEREFVHYTTFNGVSGILREKGIRMYNLKNVNDPKEYEFGANATRLSNKLIMEAKDNVYVFSTSKLHSQYRENPVLWRLYGENGYGCAIVVEIVNKPEDWHNYHLSKVYYNEKDDLDLFYKKSEEFEKNNPVQIKYDLSRLIAFHKDDFWKIEDEVRLLAFF